MKQNGKKKRTFSNAGLSVSTTYLFPAARRGMLVTGAALSLAALVYLFFDTKAGSGSFIATGDLSSAHANVESDCSTCHDFGRSASDQKCGACHERSSRLAIYNFGAHYLYRSNDATRLQQGKMEKAEFSCADCHEEHGGRQADLVAVSDKKCLACHEFGSFNRNHPEFEFARSTMPDDSTLKMTHLRHTVFVLKELRAVARVDTLFEALKAETGDSTHFFESACLYCHQPEADGTNFARIDYDKHCSRCHLQSDAIVEGLPALDQNEPRGVGVETIQQMQRRGGPGLSWTLSVNPGLTRESDGEVSKSPVFHKDPWILENLKQVQQRLYPAGPLSELLQSYAVLPQDRVDTLYQEALRTLEFRTDELKGRTELKEEVGVIRLWLQKARNRLQVPSPVRQGQAFSQLLSPGVRLPESQSAGLQQLVFDLTAASGPECQKCHLIVKASFGRVQSDQKTLKRAEFNHRAHILERGCVDCHATIPMNEKVLQAAVENLSDFRKKFPEVYLADRAATQNLPVIKSCQTCHSRSNVSNRCITCHKFHPNKLHRGNLRSSGSPGLGKP